MSSERAARAAARDRKLERALYKHHNALREWAIVLRLCATEVRRERPDLTDAEAVVALAK